METTFIKEFINEINPKTLYPKAHKAFTALPYSDKTKIRADELQEQIQNCSNLEARLSFESELDSLYQYGERISQTENFGRIIEQAVSYDGFFADYYLKCIKKAESKVSESLTSFLNDINLSGIDKQSRIEFFQDILDSTDSATYLCLDFTSEPAKAGLYILDVIKKISDIIILELGKVGMVVHHKYDYEKIKDFLTTPYNTSNDDENGLFVGVKRNYIEESDYLLDRHEVKDTNNGMSGFNSEEIEETNSHKAYQEFKANNLRLFDLELKNQRIFNDTSFRRLYELLISFNEIPEALPKDQRLKLNYPAGCKMEILGSMLDSIFGSKYLQGDKEKFNNFVQGCFLDRGGNEIDSVSSVRRKGN